MALTPFGHGHLFGTLLNHLPDEFSALFDTSPAISTLVRDSKAIMNTSVDVRETPTSYVFVADVPGLGREQVKVQVEDGSVLSIGGERTHEKRQDTDKFHRLERSTGKFLRKFRLPDDVDVDKITAAASNGVLTVTVPKVKPPEPPKPKVVDVTVAGDA